jgi:predicted nucleotidyltransferase
MVETRKDDIGSLAERYGISNVRIFGSVARGDSDSRSDIDFLVDVPRDASLFDLSRFRREPSDLLGVDVDVVSSHALLPRDRDVLEEAIGLSAAGRSTRSWQTSSMPLKRPATSSNVGEIPTSQIEAASRR